MQKGIKTRLIIYEILKELKITSFSYDDILAKKIKNHDLSQKDKNMIHSIVLNSMRFHMHIYKIIKLFAKKNITEKQFLLLLGAITQIIYLDFKEYAVVNSTVEVAKDKSISIYPGFINAILKKIIVNKDSLKKTLITFSDLPKWLYPQIDNWNLNKKKLFIETITKVPDLHIVFKNNQLLKEFNIESINTSTKSLAVKNSKLIRDLPNYEKGDWWVQDFVSMLPVYLTKNIKNKKVLDMCAAPGGKSFQTLSLNAQTTIVDISLKRSKILEINLNRLKYEKDVKVINALKIDTTIQYDYVLIDAPCSSVGTVRRNPEILYRKKEPNFIDLIDIQSKLLEKAKSLINKNGIIIYMVCSFLNAETNSQINLFLKNNKNFKIDCFNSNDSNIKNLLDKDGCINCIPSKTKGVLHDGFFAARLKKNV